MKEKMKWNNDDTLPLIQDVTDIQNIMGISRVSAYELVHTPGFPSVRSGRLIKISKKAFFNWLDSGADDYLLKPFRGTGCQNLCNAETQGKDSLAYGIEFLTARVVCEKFGGNLTAEYASSDTIRFTVIYKGYLILQNLPNLFVGRVFLCNS